SSGKCCGSGSSSSSSRSDSLTKALFMETSEPVVPYGFEVCRQRRKRTQVDPAFTRAVEIRAARGQEAVAPRHLRIMPCFFDRMAARGAFDALASALQELFKKGINLGGRIFVAARMRDDGAATGLADPCRRVGELCPLHGHVPRAVVAQIFVEYGLHIGAIARLHHVPCKVRAADQFGVARKGQGAFIGAGNTQF